MTIGLMTRRPSLPVPGKDSAGPTLWHWRSAAAEIDNPAERQGIKL